MLLKYLINAEIFYFHRAKTNCFMKKIILLSIFITGMLPVFSQKKSKQQEAFYMLDENFKGTTEKKAKYFIHSVKENDTSWQFDTYNILGPIISSEHYKDEKASVRNGEAAYFNSNGTRDSMGTFNNGIPHGSWYYFNDTGRAYLQKDFSMGTLSASVDLIKKDSIANEKSKQTKDSVAKIEIESDFAGGQKGWITYLIKNLRYPERAMNAKKSGRVRIEFIVDTEGRILDQQIVQSVEYSLDQEALRLMKESPAWIPAFQNGKKVKSYKIQPITFRLE
jgi:periplasmic protein TonB